jgi:xanthine dehydrogenase YagS FAD-binding subunit
MMKPFELVRLPLLPEAQLHVRGDAGARRFRAGGVDLLGHMKEGLEAPAQLVELAHVTDEHGERMNRVGLESDAVEIGALVTLDRLTELDFGTLDRSLIPLDALRQAADAAATPGIRRSATIGGNLLQRPRCWYYRAAELVCLKKGGSQCLAVTGDHRYHAIFDAGPSWAVHASSVATALLAFDAEVEVLPAPSGDHARPSTKRIPLADLFIGPKEDPTREHRLTAGEVLLAIRIPRPKAGLRAAHGAVREKLSHDWPLVEAAAVARFDGQLLRDVRVTLGHVAPAPWRCRRAEATLEGQIPTTDLILSAASAELELASPLPGNAYKVPMSRGLLRDVLHRMTGVPSPA